MEHNNYKSKDIFKFLIPSILGVLLLMTPFKINGSTTVLVSVLSKGINAFISSLVPIHYLVFIALCLSFFGAILHKIFKFPFIENTFFKSIFDVSYIWIIARGFGFIFCLFTIFNIGPDFISTDATGGLVLFDLIAGLFTIFLIAGTILPLLTEFGLLEYVGVFLTNVMRPLFKLPGRCAVDCVASWVGDGTIGVALTNKQYEQGYYNAKEASIIATCFSAVSITFCLVVIENVGLVDYFGVFYLTISMVGIVNAFILPYLPPLSLKKEDYLVENKNKNNETIPSGYTKNKWALKLAIETANKNFSLKRYLTNSLETVLSMWISVLPIIMAVGTLALILSEYTPLFTYLGMPFEPLLKLMQVDYALEASKTMVVGFADMVVPSIMAASIDSEKTRFIVACLSICQLIYMSETGSIILGSKIPVGLLDLFIIFIERTLISLPIIVLMAHIFF